MCIIKALKYRYVVCSLIFLFISTGCAQISNISLPGLGNEPSLVQIVPERALINDKDLAQDVKLVLSTILLQMYMEPGLPKEVRFSRAGQHQLYDQAFDYSGFSVRHIDITAHENLDDNLYRLGGIFHFEDLLKRRTSVVYHARYRLSNNEILIEESAVNPIQPTFPRVEAYYVPEQAYLSLKPGTLTDFLSWYLFAIAHAEQMTPTVQEVAEHQRWEQMSMIDRIRNPRVVRSSRYVILVFSLDRILEDGSLNINFADSSRNCPTTSHESVTIIDDRGWKIAMVGAELAIDNWSNPVFVNVGYSPGGGFRLFSGYPMLVGSFATTKNYTTLSDSQYVAGPLEQGQRFLNPRQRDDARMIQRRLAEHGFYRMEIDGLFGPGSLAALQAFKRSKGLGDNTNWDMTTQMELFAGSGL